MGKCNQSVFYFNYSNFWPASRIERAQTMGRLSIILNERIKTKAFSANKRW